MTLWHGGRLGGGPNVDLHPNRHGRMFYGPGLYLTTSYQQGKHYAKGSRSLYQVVIRKGTDIDEVTVSKTELLAFIRPLRMTKSTKEYVVSRLTDTHPSQPLPARVPIGYVVNWLSDEMNSATATNVRKWLVSHGVDYEIVPDSGKTIVVIYNPKSIVSVTRVHPRDTIEVFDLPATFVGG